MNDFTLPDRAALVFCLAIACLGCGSSGGTEALRILVTNDDGIGEPGIDAVVEALRTNPANEIVVSAPANNQTGSGDSRTTTPPPLQAMSTTTASGYPATAVDGFPADAVIYALENLYPDEPPHVVLSGLNDTQNVGDVDFGPGIRLQVDLSGTVGEEDHWRAILRPRRQHVHIQTVCMHHLRRHSCQNRYATHRFLLSHSSLNRKAQPLGHKLIPKFPLQDLARC